MDKNAIKKYAVWARRELISRVSQRAALYEITVDGYGDQNASSVHGRLMSAEEKKQRTALIAQIKEKGYEQVMEEIAYTWFNRFSALRFMEVNGYLPTRIRVFTNDDNAFKPQILDEAINMEMDGLDMQKVYDLKNANDDDALFKYMIITQCNALSSILPGMFQRISDYTELLFPDNLLREGSVVEQMIAMIPQEDWTDQVQIIGWLYQYYNTEPKDQVFANLKKNIKISKENIPAATQLFTPDWIVRYMVENSLGRLWLEGHPNDDLKAGWKYYLDEAEQEPEVQAQLAEIRKEYAAMKPEDILAIDPCQGSGHILAYMFDVLVQIYEAYGYSAREAASSIVENNIWGLDIDERAAQLAYFSVMMKARQYDRRFFSRGIQPHVYAILESNNLDPHCIKYFVDDREDLSTAMDTLVRELHDAKEYGSIVNVTNVDFEVLYARIEEIRNEAVPSIYSYQTIDTLLPFVQVAQVMAQKYHAVITNPPYMGSSNVNKTLLKYLDKNYADFRSDLSTVFMERSRIFCASNGFYALINIPVWMFISRFEKMREKFSINSTYINMLHLGRGVFGSDFGTVAFCFKKEHVSNYIGAYLRLFNEQGSVSTLEEKERWFYEPNRRYYINQDLFRNITGAPIAYSLSKTVFETFNNQTVETISESKAGVATSDNDTYLRLWYEIDFTKAFLTASTTEEFHKSGKRYAVYNKGGQFRRWYGNLDYLIKFDMASYNVLLTIGNKLPSRNYYFKKAITWSDISMRGVAFRYEPQGSVFDGSADVVFTEDIYFSYLLGLLNTNYVSELSTILNPTIHFKLGDYRKLPFIYDETAAPQINVIVNECIRISKEDWDEQEISWDFKKHPLTTVLETTSLSKVYEQRANYINWRFAKLKENEELLNSLFAKIYQIEGSISNEVNDKDVTVKTENKTDEIKGLISYAVGCMFGRYSLDNPGLIYAGGEWDASNYGLYQPDKDAIIPICDDEYFEDDIVGRFVKFIEVVYGIEMLEENLRFIADALGGKGSSREVIRNYFINDFYTDHVKMYQKRPIYWLFESGKKNGFKCLIYMHRYQPDTIARIRTDYVHEQQSRYRTAIADLESRVANTGTSERVKLTKRLDSIRAQAEELRVYEEKIHHLADQMIRIDLDDGARVNYAKFQDVLAKIR